MSTIKTAPTRSAISRIRRVVDVPRIRAEAGQQDQRLDLERLPLDGVIIEQEGLAVDGVAVRLEHLARGIEPVAVSEVAARGEIHAQQPLVAKPLADLVPLVGRQLVPVGGSQGVRASRRQELGHGGQLDPGSQDGPERHEVGIGATVRLGIGVRRAEELAGPLVGQVLDRIDIVAAGIEAVVRNALGVLVGQEVGHGALGRQRRVVLAGDQLDVAPLVGQLLDDRPGDLGRHAGHASRDWPDRPGIPARSPRRTSGQDTSRSVSRHGLPGLEMRGGRFVSRLKSHLEGVRRTNPGVTSGQAISLSASCRGRYNRKPRSRFYWHGAISLKRSMVPGKARNGLDAAYANLIKTCTWEHAMGLEFAPGKTRIGWIGTGVMGSSMCGHLIAAGYQATVYNRSAEKTKALVEKGAAVADSLAERRRGVGRGLHDRRLSPRRARGDAGPAGTLVASARPGTVLVDMTTSEPALAVEIVEAAQGQGTCTRSTRRSPAATSAPKRPGCRS